MIQAKMIRNRFTCLVSKSPSVYYYCGLSALVSLLVTSTVSSAVIDVGRDLNNNNAQNPFHHQMTGESQEHQVPPTARGENQPPALKWDSLLYDEKEIGTWCAPSEAPSDQFAVTESFAMNRMSTVGHNKSGVYSDVVTVTPSSRPVHVQWGEPDHGENVTEHPRNVLPGWLQDPLLTIAHYNQSGFVILMQWVNAALRIVRNQHSTASRIGSPCLVDDDDLCADTQPQRPQRPHRESQSPRQPINTVDRSPVPSEMNLYMAVGNRRNEKLAAVLPDGSLSKNGPRNVWLVLDPWPLSPFGHPVHVFAIDFDMVDTTCIANGGFPLEHNECLNQVFKSRCPNKIVQRRSATWRRRSADGTADTDSTSSSKRRCEVDFLPLVHSHSQAALQSDQRLLCTDVLPGFAPCPTLRSWNETSELICDPLSTNHKRCDSTQEMVKTRCRLFETCDQAVLLSGGWNWQLSGRREMRNVLSMYKMLRRNGFGKQSIKIFFANGVRAGKHHDENSELNEDIDLEYAHQADEDMSLGQVSSQPGSIHGVAAPEKSPSGSAPSPSTPDVNQETSRSLHGHRHDHRNNSPAMYPAALKIALRNHIRSLCGTPHCVDSFVVYLSSPTRVADGASLLWDADHNGEFDETEIYTVREFLRDIQDCGARQVVVLADQNYAGLLAEALARSRRHSNVMVFTSTQSHERSFNNEFTHHWANYAHSHSCLSQVFKDSLTAVTHSRVRFEDASNATLSSNVFGAPCDAVPPYSWAELKSHFMGCQYVPTRVWLGSRQAGTVTDTPPRLLTGR